MSTENSKSAGKNDGLIYEHGIVMDDTNLKGLGRIFNSETGRGRANVSKLTMGLFFGAFVYFKFIKKRAEKKSTGGK